MPGTNRSLRTRGAVLTALLLIAGAVPALAAGYQDLEKEVQEFTLPNGMHFLVLGRHDVPVFSFDTYVDCGAVNEVQGITGLAHIMEHMAFKGTPEIGTKDYKAEQKAMAAEDAAFLALREERDKGSLADSTRLKKLEADFTAAKDAARQFVVSNEFGQIVENNGGVGLNAGTNEDATQYYYSFPANRLELWAYLEGQRMAHPVLREFYTEKDGPVTEERRMRTDNNPIGMLIEQLQNVAFSAHPYQHSTIGYMSDLRAISRDDGREFYGSHYVGNNMCCAVVGDVDLASFQKLAQKYFAEVPGPRPVPRVETVEPPQKGEKRLVVEHSSQPVVLIAYHRGDINDPDNATWDALSDVLGRGRTSRLYAELVKKQKIAVQVGVFSGFPGSKYPNLFLFFGIPAKDVEPEKVEQAIAVEVDKLLKDGLTADELAGVKRRARADFIRSLDSNMGLARQLTYFQEQTGDWRNMFRQIEKIDAVTLGDCQRVAASTLKSSNRTVVLLKTVKAEQGTN